MSPVRKKGVVRRNPVTTAGAGGFSLVSLLSALGANSKTIAIVSALMAAGLVALRYLDTHGGIKGVWDRLVNGA